tara:strand:+ start:1579 stop:1773 length:195 start_codon:yes stop_codon:yes gene_type:complete
MEENISKLEEVLDILKEYSNNPLLAEKVSDNIQGCCYELEKVISDLEECKVQKINELEQLIGGA